MAKPSKSSTNPPGKSDKHDNGLLDWDLSDLPEMGIETGGPPQAYVFTDNADDIEEIAQGISIPEFPAEHSNLADIIADRLGQGEDGTVKDIDYVFVATNGKDDLVDAFSEEDLLDDADEPIQDPNGLIITGNGKDNIVAGSGDDVIFAGNAKDLIDGGDGDDAMFGENGDDTFVAGTGSDLFHGGDGFDTVDASGAMAREVPLTLEDVFTTFGIIEAQEIANAVPDMDKGEVNGVVVDLAEGILSTGGGEGDGDDTLISIESITGSEFNDFMAGDENANSFDGLGGSDYLLGRVGDDTLNGGAEADLIIGGAGADMLDGGDGDDMIFGDDDGLTPSGDAGGDMIFGGAGLDMISGEAGDDIIEGGADADMIDGGDDNDTASYASSDAAVDVNLGADTASGGHAEGDELDNIENLIGSDHGDTLTGDAEANIIDGGAGDDLIEGAGGADMIDGGDDNDTASYASSDAAVNVDLGDDTASGGHAEGDELDNIENLIGSDHDDMLAGDAGANDIDGGAGDDLIEGGDGGDMIDGGDDNDTASYARSNAAVTVNLGADTASGGHATGDMLDSIENLIGSEHGDTLTGDGGVNAINGGAGDDVIEGGDGGDMIDGGDDNDTASYASSDAAVDVNLGADTASGGHADGDMLDSIENLIGSDHEDTLTGDAEANIIDGGDGVDELHAGQGEDVMFGGNGGDNDLIILDGGNLISADDRDNSVDIVKAAATFAENGTDTVQFYGDGVLNPLAVDVIDFSDALDFTDGLTAEQQAVELLDLLYFDDVSSEIRDTGGDGSIGGGDDNAWFVIDELDNGNTPETVFVEVDGQTFEWNQAGMDWVV